MASCGDDNVGMGSTKDCRLPGPASASVSDTVTVSGGGDQHKHQQKHGM